MNDPSPDSHPPQSPQLRPAPPDDIIFYQVRDALVREGCPICRLGRQASERYLTSFLHEQVNDPLSRQRVIASRGFCARHAWMLTQFYDVLGPAIVYRHLLEKLSHDLQRAITPRRGRVHSVQAFAARVRAALHPHQICPACESVSSEEESALMGLLRRLGDPTVAERLREAAALCLPHLLRAVSLAPDVVPARWLVELHRDRYASVIARLSELIRKHDYRFTNEPVTGDEAVSWRRAIAALVGEDPLEDRARRLPYRKFP